MSDRYRQTQTEKPIPNFFASSSSSERKEIQSHLTGLFLLAHVELSFLLCFLFSALWKLRMATVFPPKETFVFVTPTAVRIIEFRSTSAMTSGTSSSSSSVYVVMSLCVRNMRLRRRHFLLLSVPFFRRRGVETTAFATTAKKGRKQD